MLGLYFLGIILLVAVDQLSKFLVCQFLPFRNTIPLWDNVFHLTHQRNTGAAWGILENQFALFFVVTVLVVAVVTIYLIKKRPKNLCLNFSLTLLVGGALGNFIDRMFRGFVVDFLDFRLIHFPVFNMADCFVVCGAILLVFYVIFLEGKEKSKNCETE